MALTAFKYKMEENLGRFPNMALVLNLINIGYVTVF